MAYKMTHFFKNIDYEKRITGLVQAQRGKRSLRSATLFHSLPILSTRRQVKRSNRKRDTVTVFPLVRMTGLEPA